MEKRIAIERLYSLGQYQNIKLVAEITGIPEHIALNKDAMGLISYSQILEIERSYYDYYRLRLEKLPKGKLEDVLTDTIEVLEQEQSRTWEQLLELIKDKEEKEKEVK